jgi:glycine oxidase
VIGAGVAGLVTATELLERGARVTLVDRAEGPGRQACSWWAGGMLAPWCERESAEEAVVTLGADAADWWARHTGAVTREGTLVLALGRDRSELRRFARRTEGHEEVDAERIAALEPDLAGKHMRGLFFAAEAHLDPRRALAELLDRLREAGVETRFGPDAEAPEGARIVDCRGLAASDTLDDLRGVKGEMLVLRTRDIALTRTVRLLHPRHPLYIVPRGDGVFMLGATTIESGERGRITARSMLELLGAAYALHPAFGEAEVLEIGVDARPAFPDNLPRVTRKAGRVFVNGLYRHGFLLSPAMAREAAAAVTDPGYSSEWIHDDHPERRTA